MDDAAVERLTIDTIRGLAMDMVEQGGCGTSGYGDGPGAVGLPALPSTICQSGGPHWAGRGRFALSSGHACALQYSLLHLIGYDLSRQDLMQFRQGESRTPEHPERSHTPGVEVTTGTLGHGCGNAVGCAMAEPLPGGAVQAVPGSKPSIITRS